MKRFLPSLILAIACCFGSSQLEAQTTAKHRLQGIFPKLEDGFVIEAPSDRTYNCIGWSMGLNQWVNPITGPENAPFEGMDKLYGKMGYRRLPDLDFSVQKGVEKVVLFGKLTPDGYISHVTHAARQESDGTWTSKLGRAPLIRHKTPGSLRGYTYGLPIAVYARDKVGKNGAK